MKENNISTEHDTMLPDLERKLQKELSRYQYPAVAFSAGIDSTLVLASAVKIHGNQCIAIMVKNEAVPQREVEEARRIADFLKCSLIVKEIDVLSLDKVARNNKKRCYYCKKMMLREIKSIAKTQGCSVVLDGSNSDDHNCYRPGAKACREEGIISPLQNCGINKTNVRNLARYWELPNWEKPSSPCLLTRFPYDMEIPITKELLIAVEQGEDCLRKICRSNFRLRWAGQGSVRIEVTEGEMEAILKHRQELCKTLGDLGFHKITMDLYPFQSGRFDMEK